MPRMKKIFFVLLQIAGCDSPGLVGGTPTYTVGAGVDEPAARSADADIEEKCVPCDLVTCSRHCCGLWPECSH